MLAFDLAIVLISVWFINFLHVRINQYSAQFDRYNVELRDFSLRIRNLPYDIEYGGRQLQLQAQLWCFLERVTKNYMLERADLL